MFEIYQQTVSKPVTFEGIGLHSGKKSKMRINSSEVNSGIIFKRTDLYKNNEIEGIYKNVTSAKLCTTLENKFGVKVSTVEHILAALYIVGIDNAIIEIDNEEAPIMDGSAKEFIEVLKKIGTKKLKEKRRYLKILNKVQLVEGKKEISIEPNQTFKVNFQLNYKNKIIGNQKNSVNFSSDNLVQVYESRTFCLYEDIENIKKIGLAKGGSLENAIVVDNEKILNKDGLRNDKEFVNHKILDLAGDFMLSGFRVIGQINCYQGGHELTNIFLRKLLNLKSSSSIVEMNNLEISKKIRPLHSISIAASA